MRTDLLTTTTKYENQKVPHATAEHDVYMSDAANSKEYREDHSCPLVGIVAIRIDRHVADLQ
jgi:hypothetical protein